MIGEVGMGGAGTPLAAAATAAKAAAVSSVAVDNASLLGTPGQTAPSVPSPQAIMMPPTTKEAATAEHAATEKAAEIVCGITVNSLHVNCQHDGRQPKDGLLDVVPSMGGDTITAQCGIIGSCGPHPTWEIGGYWTSEKHGSNISFNARDFEGLPKESLRLPVWLGNVSPHEYTVDVSSCSGPEYSFQINAYPNDAQEAKFSADLYEETLKEFRDGVKELLETLVDKPVFDFLKGGGSYSLQWKEDPSSNRAFYSWQLSAGFNPFLALGARFPLGPQAALPAEIRQYLNAGFFLEVKGEIAFSLEGGQLNPPWSDKGHFDAKGEANLTLTVGGSVFLGEDQEDSVLWVEVAIQSGIGLEVVGSIEEHQPVVDVKVAAGGLQGYALFHFMFYEKKTQCTIFDKQTIAQKQFYPFASSDGESN